ncbi:MAG TPA: isoprenylcysteine carboxylmethyltransferase family protein [Verrucomicrobiae bacterium]|nr:isoprenylcysteine carboxylmethyltransferase family protein [Verrucomicrobiae bacterium]
MEKLTGFIIIGCWITFLAYWLISAMQVKAVAERQSRWSALAHRIPLGCSYVLLAVWYLPPPMNLSVTPHADWARGMGAAICGLGLCVTLWARWTLAGNWSSDVTFKQGHELVKTGTYRFVRHPIYTGLLVMSLGTALDIGKFRGWLALPLMTAAFWIKLKQEERLMLRHFPDQYPAYQKQVKAIVPFVI